MNAHACLLLLLGACTYITKDEIAERTDLDGDGFRNQDDCDPDDPDVGAGTLWYTDADGDGFGGAEEAGTSCEAPDGAAPPGDCDDALAEVYPGAEELCGDGQVNDCAGSAALSWERCGLAGEQDLGDLSGPSGEPVDVFTLYGASSADLVGTSLAVATLGDSPAIAVGAPGVGAYKGAVFLLSGAPDSSGAIGNFAAEILGERIGDLAGFAVAGVGDVDGDGQEDLGIGAPSRAGDALDACVGGSAYVLLDPMAVEDLGEADGEFSTGEADCAGNAMSGAGDLDGDGLDDVLVGAPALGEGDPAVWVLPGGELGSLDGAAVELSGSEGTMLGYSVAGGEDLDGDGVPELLLGAPGPEGVGARLYVLPGDVPDALSLDAAAVLVATARTDVLGGAVVVFGDNDGDGAVDVAVSARAADAGVEDGGAIYVLNSPPPTASGQIEGYADATVRGMESGAATGYGLAPAGDVDGDGSADLLIGAPASDGEQEDSGVVVLALGPLSGESDAADTGPRFRDERDYLGLGVSLGSFRSDDAPWILLGAPGYGATTALGRGEGAVYALALPTW